MGLGLVVCLDGQPFDVSTGKRLYRNMLIKSLAVQTDAASETALLCTVGLREIQLVPATSGRPQASSQRDPGKTAPVVDRGSAPLIRLPSSEAIEKALFRAQAPK